MARIPDWDSIFGWVKAMGLAPSAAAAPTYTLCSEQARLARTPVVRYHIPGSSGSDAN